MAGNSDIIDTRISDAEPSHVAMALTAIAMPPKPCLRANESSQQQLVRLVGYRGPSADTAASWDRLRRAQAALQGAS